MKVAIGVLPSPGGIRMRLGTGGGIVFALFLADECFQGTHSLFYG